ncbi:hypothetical protein MMKA1_08190 [Methanococcus maripaludis KA1]|jgi:hypothetical protein|uniref:Uncharacterized protein n=2 Tax=Methanococcus maripaludis TaxID=39152 RepID=A0A2Z5PJK7_METMI|nr:DUF2975 domain-containing protein [Methanococcus maripaludis]BAP60936.1 hypothetical protein MMKA1_08190 [Methanococcus maripaludis KA1]
MERIIEFIKKHMKKIILFLISLLFFTAIAHFYWNFDLIQIFSKFMLNIITIISLTFGLAALVTASYAIKQVQEMKEQRKLQNDPEVVLTSNRLILILFNGHYKDGLYNYLENRLSKKYPNNQVKTILDELNHDYKLNLYYWDNLEMDKFGDYLIELENVLDTYVNFKINNNTVYLEDILKKIRYASFKNAKLPLYNLGNGPTKNIHVNWEINYKSLVDSFNRVRNLDIEYSKNPIMTNDPNPKSQYIESINLNMLSTGFEDILTINDFGMGDPNSEKYPILLPANTGNKIDVPISPNFIKLISYLLIKYPHLAVKLENTVLPVSINYQDVKGNNFDTKKYDVKIKLLGGTPHHIDLNGQFLEFQILGFEFEAEDVINSEE